ncbi:4-alpha-glucanotransferase [Photorhabdus cinerea]|uniref:4-alpha-glucanotransferase n=1 Tax=Photorhabdus cinerea TaxID=471575 RepID=A0A7X5QG92_9GAMM|nr:4-alpha-glucanotransferase [Photorhabdus cinerea]NHB93861.1 4-alpha-glucanotransferase [Photorhabdus cinerea]
MEEKSLDHLATEAGIVASYINAYGKPQAIPTETRHRLLEAISVNKPANTPVSPLPPVKVFTQGQSFTITLKNEENYQWRIRTEEGEEFQGHCRHKLILPNTLTLGYHCLTLTQGSQCWPMQIIVAPKRCYEPDSLLKGEKLWGACVQLYTLRSETNWGIGDFGDLKYMLKEVATRGGSFIGLNPLHALYPAMPESASPYSPSSRNWLNIIYIDVNQVEDFKCSEEAQIWWQKQTTQNMLRHARNAEWVDYTTVMALKIAALRLAYQQFNTRLELDFQQVSFRQFIIQGGECLYYQGVYDALHYQLYAKDSACWGWPAWPEKYNNPHNEAVQAFCQSHAQEVEFFLWLQWLADTQLADCFAQSQTSEMPIGLYRDLAVGVAEGGAETWCNRAVYCTKASVGAPPDALGPLGQNWGLPPMNPHVLQTQSYQPFINLLRTNMTYCGALRIDHVMSMLRLWWIPYGETADKGAYVHYPVDDLMAILALESQRHRCMIIGEDLGIVPEEIVGKLRDSGVYSYKVFYFERHGNGEYRAPENYPTQAMATITTHDLPTLRGFWQSDDLTLGESLKLYPDKDLLQELYTERQANKQGLLEGLHRYGYIPEHISHIAKEVAMSPVINQGLHRYISHSTCSLLGLQPEDWLDMDKPVNVPGTIMEYPNWRRKLNTTLESMFDDDHVNQLLKDVDKCRKKTGTARG